MSNLVFSGFVEPNVVKWLGLKRIPRYARAYNCMHTHTVVVSVARAEYSGNIGDVFERAAREAGFSLRGLNCFLHTLPDPGSRVPVERQERFVRLIPWPGLAERGHIAFTESEALAATKRDVERLIGQALVPLEPELEAALRENMVRAS